MAKDARTDGSRGARHRDSRVARERSAGHGSECVVYLALHKITGMFTAIKCVELVGDNDREQLDYLAVRSTAMGERAQSRYVRTAYAHARDSQARPV